MSFLLWVEATILLLAAVLAGLGAGWITPEVVLQGTTLSQLTIRTALAVLAAAFFGGFVACLALWRHRQGLAELLRQPGPRGQIFIAPRTVTELAGGLLAEELPETSFRVHLQPKKGGLLLRVFLRLPKEASIPEVAERVQELLTAELSRRTGLTVQEVQVVVHGAAPSPR